jgi:hypothetical protein
MLRAAWHDECQDRDCECTPDHHQPHVSRWNRDADYPDYSGVSAF